MDKIFSRCKEVGDGCRQWEGAVDSRSGLPVAMIKGKHTYLRRHVYESYVGKLLHNIIKPTCGNKLCLEPKHMEVVLVKPKDVLVPHEEYQSLLSELVCLREQNKVLELELASVKASRLVSKPLVKAVKVPELTEACLMWLQDLEPTRTLQDILVGVSGILLSFTPKNFLVRLRKEMPSIVSECENCGISMPKSLLVGKYCSVCKDL